MKKPFGLALSDFQCLEDRRGCLERSPPFSIFVPTLFDEAKIAVSSLEQQNTPPSVNAI